MLGLAVCLVLSALAALHLVWAAGGARQWADAAVPMRADGRPLFEPSRAATIAVAVALAAAAATVMAVSGHWQPPLPAIAVRAAAVALVLVFVARGIGDFRWVGMFKRERHGRFARLDTRFYSPLCLLLGAAVAAITLDA
ncbi:DUF3995 domain-containing protein [Marilutibacter maris]|uniref:DUF3995 domain-containing protein n=1 Tax=Marilutibacter maris TaxID=1605891 RepID=A0A2U9TA88_9GAMM|nr:DUF3995 domain-containing protein [Lysobacter maris]AWV06439.1 hypothetical protein C9I47_0718 [Lysobacter maris]KAB8167677.1 DUF3995 domain-containing protein [Lysobacter maris]